MIDFCSHFIYLLLNPELFIELVHSDIYIIAQMTGNLDIQIIAVSHNLFDRENYLSIILKISKILKIQVIIMSF